MPVLAVLFMPALGAAGAGSFSSRARAQAKNWKHGLSLFGDVKYPDGFRHFDYVNPDAPQGGTVRQGTFGTFDNFNIVIAGVKGSIAAGTELFVETLMTPALDEVSTEYGLLAEAVSHPTIIHRSVIVCAPARAGTTASRSRRMTCSIHSRYLKANSPFYGAYYQTRCQSRKDR